MGEYEKRSDPTPTSQVAQLGTEPKIAAKGEYDSIKLTYLVPSEKLPDQFKPILYRLTRRDVVVNRKRFDEALTDNYLRLLNAIYGRGQDNIIKAELALKGAHVPLGPPPEKPSILDRIMDRDKVREYERWEERKEIGLE